MKQLELNPILNEALADVRKQYIERYEQMAMAQLVELRAGLKAVGMDADKYAPYPHGNMDRKSYKLAESKYKFTRYYFRSIKGCRSMNEPEIVAELPGMAAKCKAQGRSQANQDVDSYIIKLEKKITGVSSSPVAVATANGKIWDNATLDVKLEDKTLQRWDTQCILNTSCLGKLFNQWRTRLVLTSAY